jgi:hypothetical protein
VRRQSKAAKDIAELRQQQRWTLLVERGAACEYPGCDQPWSDVHEILSRGRGGDPTDMENQLCLCRPHHKHITEHPKEAEAMGLVRARTAEEHTATFRPWLNRNPLPELEL